MDINTLGAIAVLAVVVLTAFYLFQRVKARGKVGPFEAEIDTSNEPKPGIELDEDAKIDGSVATNWVGGDRTRGSSQNSEGGKTGGIKIGKGAMIKDSDVSNWTGGDDKRE